MSGALLVELGEQSFALPLGEVREVLRAAQPMALPRAPFGCLGLLDVRGEAIPLLDLAALLTLRSTRHLRDAPEALVDCHLVLAWARGVPVALVVDRVLEVASAAEISAEVDPGLLSALGRGARLVRGQAQAGTHRALLLSLEELISPRRAERLQAARQQARPELHP